MSRSAARPDPAPLPADAEGWHWGAAAAATFCITLWGAVPLITKIAAEDFDGDLIGVLRTVFCLPVVMVLLAAGRRSVPRGWEVWRALILVGVISFIAFPVLYSLGQSLTSASHGGLIIATAPILTGITSAIWNRRRPGRAWIVGAMLGFAGVASLILIRADGAARPQAPSLAGDLLVLAGIASAAIGYVWGTRLSKILGAQGVTYWANMVAAVLLLPWAAWVLGGMDLRAVGWTAWTAIAYLAVFAQVVNYVLWYWAMDRGGIARIAAFQFVQPVVTLILAVIFLSEVMTLPLLVSAALILAGVGLCQFKR